MQELRGAGQPPEPTHIPKCRLLSDSCGKEQSNPQIRAHPSRHRPLGKVPLEKDIVLYAASVGQARQAAPGPSAEPLLRAGPSNCHPARGSLVSRSPFTPGTPVPLVRHLTSIVCGVWFGPAGRPHQRGAGTEGPGGPQAELVSAFRPRQVQLQEAGGLAPLGASESDPYLLGSCEDRGDVPVQV